jgi:hypothetical protein
MSKREIYNKFINKLIEVLEENGVNFKKALIEVSACCLKMLNKLEDTGAYQLQLAYEELLIANNNNPYNARYLFETDPMSLNRLKGFQNGL